ncbi:MAG: FkbM family methyltransferase [Cyclobacteriaceae bacterium]|nr:FkbM family methyltransferase [Cyclobacteriaceae bacterium]
MNFTNRIIKILDTPISRGLLKQLIYIGYKRKGIKIEGVQAHIQFNAWEFRIEGVSYLSSGPGWVYEYGYLLDQLKALSGHAYLPKAGDVVFDIGAGVGEETIIFSKLVGDTGKVFSIEAHPRTFKALAYLVEVNGLSNVFPVNVAFSNEKGAVEIDDSENSLANSILPSTKDKSFKVTAVTFDEFVSANQIKSIDLVKMNVEGAEQLIIKGMINSLSIIKHLAISCHDFRYKNGESEFFKTKEIVLEFLRYYDFIISTQDTKDYMVDDYVYATNPRAL